MSDLFTEGAAEVVEDARRLLGEIDQQVPGSASVTADCRPPLDVLETTGSVEVVVDLPGVAPADLRVAIRRGLLLVVGRKRPAAIDAKARFHLAERGYGRFARAVHLTGVFDGQRARAIIKAGQLRVVLPRVEERRGHLLTIPVDTP